MSYTKDRKRLLSSAELEAGARSAIAAAGAEGIDVAILGGYAMALYGSDRLTVDVAIVASGPIAALPPAERLTFGGYSSLLPQGFSVDVILRDDEYLPLYQEALSNTHCIEGLPVVSLPYLMAMKMASARPKDELDLRWLMATYDEPAILDEARRIIGRHLGVYAAREFDSDLSLARWERQQSGGGRGSRGTA